MAFSASLFIGCKDKKKIHEKNPDSVQQFKIDTLRVVTLYGPTSYFEYRGEKMGIDYDNVIKFAEKHGLPVSIQPVENIPQLISKLKNGEAQLAAYPVPLIGEYKKDIIYCGQTQVTRQVLVRKKDSSMLKDVTELIGKEITVAKNSKYHFRLENLNEELGGGIIINLMDNDTIVEEDLLKMVNSGEIKYTVVDSEIANIYSDAFPELDASMSISADQAASWAVAPGYEEVANKINEYDSTVESPDFLKEIYKKYYDRSVNEDFDTNLTFFKKLNLHKGENVSEYDSYFQKYASTAGHPWTLLAAIAYCESRYNTGVVSPFGATGLMQVMPNTARGLGIDPGALTSPDSNVKAASLLLAKLDKSLEPLIEDSQERIKFVVAAYNSGLGHIYDAIALAEKIGLNPQKWYANVGVAALMKSRPEYYNDPVVKHGYFRGRETVDFVDHVTGIYYYLNDNIKAKNS